MVSASIVVFLILVIMAATLVYFDAYEMRKAMLRMNRENRILEEIERVSNSELSEINKHYLLKYYSSELKKVRGGK